MHFAGEYLSQIGAWQEGAALSAHHAIAAIAKRVGDGVAAGAKRAA